MIDRNASRTCYAHDEVTGRARVRSCGSVNVNVVEVDFCGCGIIAYGLEVRLCVDESSVACLITALKRGGGYNLEVLEVPSTVVGCDYVRCRVRNCNSLCALSVPATSTVKPV